MDIYSIHIYSRVIESVVAAGRVWGDADVQLHEAAGHLPLQHHHPRGVLGEEHPLQARAGRAAVRRPRLEKRQNRLCHQRCGLLPAVLHHQQAEDGESGHGPTQIFLLVLLCSAGSAPRPAAGPQPHLPTLLRGLQDEHQGCLHAVSLCAHTRNATFGISTEVGS